MNVIYGKLKDQYNCYKYFDRSGIVYQPNKRQQFKTGFSNHMESYKFVFYIAVILLS